MDFEDTQLMPNQTLDRIASRPRSFRTRLCRFTILDLRARNRSALRSACLRTMKGFDHSAPTRITLMKILILVLTSVLVLQLQSSLAASSEEEARFVAAARQAFAKHDADALAALTCWDRVPDKFKASGKKQYVRDVAQTATDITLANPDPDYPDLVWKDTDGVSYRSNLSVVKQLKITFAPGKEFGDARYPIGEKGGKLYLLEPAPVK